MGFSPRPTRLRAWLQKTNSCCPVRHLICAVITSNLALAKASGNVRLSKQDSNLPRESVINVSQILTLDRSHLIDCVGSVPKRIIVDVDEGLRVVLGLTW